MTQPARQLPALVAMGLALGLGLWGFAVRTAQPDSAVPAPVARTIDTDQAISRADAAGRQPVGQARARLVHGGDAPDSGAPSTDPASQPATGGQIQVVPSVVVAGVAGVVWPVDAPVTSPFGLRYHPVLHVVKLHTGMDLGAACGTPVAAALAGTVTYAGVDQAYGGRVVVDHGAIGGHRIATTYSHLSALGVRVGQPVVAGTGVGLVGTTGFSTGCHLHVELLVDGAFVDPYPWFRNGTITTATLGPVVPVAQVADPVPEPETPDQTTTPLLAASATPSPAPTVAVSTQSSAPVSPAPQASSTPRPEAPSSGSSPPSGGTPSAVASLTPTPSSASSTPRPSGSGSATPSAAVSVP